MMAKIVRLVEKRFSLDGADAVQVERQIDLSISELYGLSDSERNAIGMGV